jgi:hypothetical protein
MKDSGFLDCVMGSAFSSLSSVLPPLHWPNVFSFQNLQKTILKYEMEIYTKKPVINANLTKRRVLLVPYAT